MLFTSLDVNSSSPLSTQDLGQKIGQLASPGDIILLSGPLGAGKTCLTQGIARGMEIHEVTTSPTFMLVREYKGRLPLFHIDLYRLESGEITDLGLEEYLYGQGVSVIEWPEKDPGLFSGDHLHVEITYAGEKERHIQIQPQGSRYIDMVATLRKTTPQGQSRCTWR